ncbi:MAG: hypothetical protein GXY64_04670 [Bacteroidales bacterium]|nr:hypothetical protein [Bacteroidales bacterium]
MKKFISIFVCCLIASASMFAQTENPEGLYRLQKMTYENGRPDHTPEFIQYKYLSAYPITIMVGTATPKEYVYSIRQDEPHPYTYTGDKLVGEDGHGTRIYDSNKDHFTLKWYNTIRPRPENIFPMNEYITEIYDKKNMEPRMTRTIEMLEMKHQAPKNRFAGCWRMIGNVGEVNGLEVLAKPTTNLYKIYGEKDVLLLFQGDESITGSTVYYWPAQFNSDNVILEGKNKCDIQWRNDKTFVLSFDRGDGIIVKEMWMQTGLPASFQKLFGTNIPIQNMNVSSGF